VKDAHQAEQFVQQLIACQRRLYGFILALLADPDQADDVLQETNLVLWRKAEEFTAGTDFGAWACRVAHFQVLAHRRSRQRDRHVFDDALLRDLAGAAVERGSDLDSRLRALRRCLARLAPPQRDLLQRRYAGEPVKTIAAHGGRSAGSISQTLYRLRDALLRCVRRELVGGSPP
jgi:RNA polymerase sigma-70 factor (ECF subfamily)